MASCSSNRDAQELMPALGGVCSCWQMTPDCILVEIFSYLGSKDLLMTAQTCRNWCRVSYDDCLWRRVFLAEWKVPSSSTRRDGDRDHQQGAINNRLAPGRASWRAEHQRIACHAPTVQCEVLAGHTDQVLHASFSHDGRLFATCSKDAFVKVWNSNYPASICHSYDLREFKWHCAQFSQFNESDTLLLVSGILGFGSVLGEIAVFNLRDEFTLQCRVQNKPYDIFGTWYTDDYILSGDHRFLGNRMSCAMVYLNKASQETESVYTSVVSRLYKFYNKNGFVRSIMIANCEVEKEEEEEGHGDQATNASEEGDTEGDGTPTARDSEKPSSDDGQPECDNGEIILDTRNKYLIFTSGSKTYIPHRIGFKKIRPFRFQERLKFTNLKDKLAEHRAQQLHEADREHPNWLDEQSIQHMFDKVDHYVDLHGYIVGMALSPDHKFLYVNSRPWPADCHIEDPMQPPPIAQEIDIHVIDMETLRDVNTMYTSHKAFTPNEECFFIFLDVSNSYVASGAENNSGYLWDRHYQHCVARLPHGNVVNCVAFNPCDEGVLVTTSDDHLIKVWRSVSFVRQMRQSGKM